MKILLLFILLFSIGSFINYRQNLKNIEITKNNIVKNDTLSQTNNIALPKETETNIKDNNSNEAIIIDHFQNIENDIDENIGSEKTENYIYNNIDFLFYGEEINGITFSSLTESTKQKILSIVNNINSKVDEKLPNLKPAINETTTNVTNFSKEKINDYKDYTKEAIGEDNYNLISDKKNEIKEGIKDSGSKIKEKIDKGIDKLSSWYQNKRDN